MMKKILYDNQMFTFQRFGGVTRYFADLLYNLPSNEFVGELPMVFCENHYVTNTYGREYRTLSESIVRLYYLPKSNQWINVKDGDEEDEAITTLEARQIIGLYSRLDLDMKPLSEFPVETEIGT